MEIQVKKWFLETLYIDLKNTILGSFGKLIVTIDINVFFFLEASLSLGTNPEKFHQIMWTDPRKEVGND